MSLAAGSRSGSAPAQAAQAGRRARWRKGRGEGGESGKRKRRRQPPSQPPASPPASTQRQTYPIGARAIGDLDAPGKSAQGEGGRSGESQANSLGRPPGCLRARLPPAPPAAVSAGGGGRGRSIVFPLGKMARASPAAPSPIALACLLLALPHPPVFPSSSIPPTGMMPWSTPVEQCAPATNRRVRAERATRGDRPRASERRACALPRRLARQPTLFICSVPPKPLALAGVGQQQRAAQRGRGTAARRGGASQVAAELGDAPTNRRGARAPAQARICGTGGCHAPLAIDSSGLRAAAAAASARSRRQCCTAGPSRLLLPPHAPTAWAGVQGAKEGSQERAARCCPRRRLDRLAG